MKLGLQMGHGMQGLAGEFLENQGTGNPVILSPRNTVNRGSVSAESRLVSFATGPLRRKTNEMLLDPQLYVGERTVSSLKQFSYWRACGGRAEQAPSLALEELARLNEACETDLFIVPSGLAESVDSQYGRRQSAMAVLARKYSQGHKTLLTVALGQDVLRSESGVEMLLRMVEQWDADGFYLVCEHPRGNYLVEQPLWLYNYLSLVASIKRSGRLAFSGYCSHQMLCLSLAHCDVLCSGNFLNVRAFDRNAFIERPPSPSQRATWYYAPQALSEFKVSTLDLAFVQGLLSHLAPPFGDDGYAGALFGGAQPSDTAYDERCSFIHYLISMNRQCEQLSGQSYRETYSSFTSILKTADLLMQGLGERGVVDRRRSLEEALPAMEQAVAAFNSNWGFQMSHEWSEMER